MTTVLYLPDDAAERETILGAWRRLRECGSFAGALEDLDALDLDLTVRFRPDQTEDALLKWVEDGAELDLATYFSETERGRLPAVLAHEILGHALWEGKARAQGIFGAVHFHLCNELNARLLGWIATLELDISSGSYAMLFDYCVDPEGFGEDLLFLSPHYVLLMTSAEMRSARRAMQDRLNRLLLVWTETPSGETNEGRSAQMIEMIRSLTGTIIRMEEEPDQQSERWFAGIADCDLVRELERATQGRDAELRRRLDLKPRNREA